MLVPRLLACALLVGALAGHGRIASAEGWKAGTAKLTITPSESMWMAGYGGRDHPSEGVLHDLWAKALVLEDPDGKTVALITLDICGISRPLSVQIRDRLHARFDLERDRVVLACSHTHTGPVVGTNLITMYPLDEDQKGRVEDYAKVLADRVVDAVGRALDARSPATLAWETGRCDFAVNRRNNVEKDVDDLRSRLALEGPVDHDVPVLRVEDEKGALQAVVFGYACHCTVLSFYKFSGDYAGFAQLAIEKAHPGVQAMFVAGCGADQNPLPRRSVELAESYGNQLAASVEKVLSRPMRPVEGSIQTSYEEIDLAFGSLPDRQHWEAESQSDNRFHAARAKALLERMESDGALSTTYPYPIEAWRLGDLTWIFLGGEVVVDYSLRLKRNLGGSHTWVSGYCNDVMAYIPSLRVLNEGGYEGGDAMVYYGLPAPWSDQVEQQVIDGVRAAITNLGEDEVRSR